MSEATQKKQRLEKSSDAFRTISEVSQTLDVQQHVLRFWETKFNQIKPVKRGGGRRYYRPEDIEVLKYIHTLLYGEGYTIKGVQKLLKTQTKAELMQAAAANTAAAPEQPLVATRSGGTSVQTPAPLAQVVVPQSRDAVLARQMRQKAILQSMLGDLVELRNSVRAVRDGAAE